MTAHRLALRSVMACANAVLLYAFASCFRGTLVPFLRLDFQESLLRAVEVLKIAEHMMAGKIR